MLVWGQTQTGRRKDYCALVEALSATTYVGVAKTLAVVKRGRIPLRICNTHAYAVTVSRSQKLAKLYCIEEAHVHGPQDLNLIMKDDSIVEIVMMDVTTEENQKLPKELSNLANCANLTGRQQEDLRALLRKWSRVFAQRDEDFGRTDLVQHPMRTGDAPPIIERYRPLPPAMYKEMKSLLAEMLEKGVIKESCCPWAAPIVLVRNTHKDAFPLPRIEETLTNLTQAEWFSTLDLASGYWQVAMDPKDREKTAFTTPLGV